MIAEEDPDGDGVITKDEFTKMLDKNNRKGRNRIVSSSSSVWSILYLCV